MRNDTTNGIDLALVLDTTGSMGTHLGEIRRKLVDLVGELSRNFNDLRTGVVAFKDHDCEDYLTKTLEPTGSFARLVDFLSDPALAPGVGGGGAEAVECALHELGELSWRPKARKIAILVGDKPPHGAGLDGFSACAHGVDYRDEIEALRLQGVSVYTVRVGGCLETQRVFEYISARTGGTYLDLLHVRDLPASLVSVCHKEAGNLGAYRRRLERAGRLTATRRHLLTALAG